MKVVDVQFPLEETGKSWEDLGGVSIKLGMEWGFIENWEIDDEPMNQGQTTGFRDPGDWPIPKFV